MKWTDNNGLLHRPERGPMSGYNSNSGQSEPAQTFNGNKYWYKHGKRNRNILEGPALIESNSDIYTYYVDDKIHNLYGPAKSYGTNKRWYIDNVEIRDSNVFVTKIITNKEKGYFVWMDNQNRIHRPMFGPFSKDHDETKYESSPAIFNELGKFWYQYGAIVKHILYDDSKIPIINDKKNEISEVGDKKDLVEVKNKKDNNENNENKGKEVKLDCYCGRFSLDDNDPKIILCKKEIQLHQSNNCQTKNMCESDSLIILPIMMKTFF